MALRFFMFHAATNEPRLSLTPRPRHEGIRMMTTPSAMSHRGACRTAAARQPFQALRASEADIRRLSPHRLTPCDVLVL